jgi:hypothetical protein
MNLLVLFLLLAAPAATDIAQRLARWKPVEMPYHPETLNARERQEVDKLVAAAREIEAIYWQQSDPEALELYKTTQDARLKRLLFINGARFDLIDENKPFVGTKPIPPGRNLYPEGLTSAQIEAYVKAHPAEKDAIYNPYTILRWEGGKPGTKLEATPYHVEYKKWLEPAAKSLREAADLSDDKDFAQFLRMRADALLSDDYYPSDLKWLDLKNPKIDVIFAPYETYLDDVLGVKTSYEAALLIRNEPESAKLALYQKYIPDIQDALPLATADRPSKRGQPTPMEVMDAPFRTGDLLHGYQAVADNLPNDPRIHDTKGTKKIFFINFLFWRLNAVILPISKKLMPPSQTTQVSADGFMASVVLHEISHGLGPAFSRVNGKRVEINEALGPVYSGLEEAKADVVGMFGLKWLVDHGALPKDQLDVYYASYVASIFRTLRFGVAEAHGKAELMEFNYLLENNALTYKEGVYTVNFDKMPVALAQLSKELLDMEATGNRKRAEAWFVKYNEVPGELKKALEGTKGIPVDIFPTFALGRVL